MKTIEIKVSQARIGEVVTLSSGYSVIDIQVISFDGKKVTCKNIKRDFVFKLDSDKKVKAQRELSKDYINNRIQELSSLLKSANKELKEGLKSGVFCHPSDADGVTYLSGEAYTRMVGYISQLQNELNHLSK